MKSKTMNNFKVIEKNIKKVLLNKKWLVNIGCNQQYALNYKVAINFETNEVFTMEKNSYMASYNREYDDNVKYFNIPDFKYIQDDFEIANTVIRDESTITVIRINGSSSAIPFL